jgi:acetylornithine/succinyldiaminopimelate/putrescine aminotransferase
MPSIDVRALLEARAGEELALNDRHLNPQLGRILRTLGFDRSWRGADGAHLIDSSGDRYLDMLAGYGVFSVGRNNPRVRAQLEAALEADTANLPQLGVTLLAGVLAEQLLARAPRNLGHVVLTSTGTETVEAAIKLARGATGGGRVRILHCEHAFHGLTNGSLALNGNEEFRAGFGPFLPGTAAVGFGDLDALERELRAGDVAAFVVEPVQGKGVNLPPSGYLAAAQQLCRDHGALFVCDEVQTGLGRTGRFLALEHWGLEPDMVLVAKALSGGYVPVGAVLATPAVFGAVFDEMEHAVVHGSTFGGNDLAAAAGLAALSEIDDAGLVERARRGGELLLERTRPLVERYELVREVRGLGLMWAIELGPPAGRAGRALWRTVEARQPGLFAQLVAVPLFHDHHILIQVAGHAMNVVKAIPPLVISDEEIERFATALDDVVGRAERRLFSSTARVTLSLGRRALRA